MESSDVYLAIFFFAITVIVYVSAYVKGYKTCVSDVEKALVDNGYSTSVMRRGDDD